MRDVLKRAAFPTIAALTLICAAPLSGRAADPALDPLVITASRYVQSAYSVPAYLTVVSSASLKAVPAQTLDDALRTMPGVNISLGSSRVVNPALQTVSMLGAGGTGRALVLLDGLPLTDGFTSFVPWSKVPPALVERVEILRGGNSNLYGTNAMSGVINVITRAPKERALDLDYSYGEHDQSGHRSTRIFNVYASETFLDKFGLSVGYNDYYTDGYAWLRTIDRGPIDHNATARNWALNIKAASLRGGAGGPLWFVRGMMFQDARNHGMDQFFDSRDEMDLAAGFRLPLDSAGEVRGNAFVGKHLLDSTNAAISTGRFNDYQYVHNVLPSLDSGASLQWSNIFDLLSSSVTAGVDVRNVSARNDESDFSTTGVFQNNISSGGTQTTIGLFGQWSLDPLPGLTLVPSGRLDYWQNHGAFQDTFDGTGHQALPSKSYTFFSPRLAARYQATEPLALRGAVYRAFVAPTLQNLYRGARPQGQIQLPNPDLSPEVLRVGGEFGWDLALGPATFRATGFWSEISNSIGSVTIVSGKLTKVQNISSIRVRGATFEVPWQVSRQWAFTPSYTYTNAIIMDSIASPGTAGNMIPNIPRHQAAFALGFDDPRIATAQLRGRYLTRRYGDDANTQLLDEHFVMDFSASRWLTKNLEVYGDVENLLSRSYTAVQLGALPLLGEPFYAALGLRLHYR
ncbi:MAG: TonB-dependent receptor [Elusimicrobia bacterium]|nr:TonB-dependent receptor [Elusimicrobiota bacterium]